MYAGVTLHVFNAALPSADFEEKDDIFKQITSRMPQKRVKHRALYGSKLFLTLMAFLKDDFKNSADYKKACILLGIQICVTLMHGSRWGGDQGSKPPGKSQNYLVFLGIPVLVQNPWKIKKAT